MLALLVVQGDGIPAAKVKSDQASPALTDTTIVSTEQRRDAGFPQEL